MIQAYLAAANRLRKLKAENKWRTYYPDEGPLRRELYPKHCEFFAAGLYFRERCMLAANRVGKTEGIGGYESMLHLTGLYPDWWPGRRWSRPIKAWIAGDTSKTVREISQEKLLGPWGEFGTGLIPASHIISWTPRSGVPEAVDTVRIKHASGGVSRLVFKSYDQKRLSFQGSEQDLIWLDEEPPEDIYTECLVRLMTTRGALLCTFTPLSGLTPVVLSFMPDGTIPKGGRVVGFEPVHGAVVSDSRYLGTATWDDVPHLGPEERQELLDSIPTWQRDARSKGVPQLGSGAIYPVPEDDYLIDPFPIPTWWPRGYALDVGWNRTAALWGAWDRENDVLYLYDEYYRGEAEPAVHATAIRARGDWIQGIIDPAARGRAQTDGGQLLTLYREEGLHLSLANNALEAGLVRTFQLLSAGKIRVFRHLENFKREIRLYRRDEKGKIVGEDHLMDCMRYAINSGMRHFITKPAARDELSFREAIVCRDPLRRA